MRWCVHLRSDNPGIHLQLLPRPKEPLNPVLKTRRPLNPPSTRCSRHDRVRRDVSYHDLNPLLNCVLSTSLHYNIPLLLYTRIHVNRMLLLYNCGVYSGFQSAGYAYLKIYRYIRVSCWRVTSAETDSSITVGARRTFAKMCVEHPPCSVLYKVVFVE